MKTNHKIISCNCGHRIFRGEVIQTGLYLGLMGPNYIYVRFRCARCRRVGERLVEEELWDPAVLQQKEAGVTDADRRRFRDMGGITPEEVIDFHYALQRLSGEPEGEAEQS